MSVIPFKPRAQAAELEREKMHHIIDKLTGCKSYWTVIWWLCFRAGQLPEAAVPKFWCLDEAIAFFGPRIRQGEEYRLGYVVARHFRNQGPGAWS